MVVGVAAKRVLPPGSRRQPVPRRQTLSEQQAQCGGGTKTPRRRRLSPAVWPALCPIARAAGRLDDFLRHLRKDIVSSGASTADDYRRVVVLLSHNLL